MPSDPERTFGQNFNCSSTSQQSSSSWNYFRGQELFQRTGIITQSLISTLPCFKRYLFFFFFISTCVWLWKGMQQFTPHADSYMHWTKELKSVQNLFMLAGIGSVAKCQPGLTSRQKYPAATFECSFCMHFLKCISLGQTNNMKDKRKKKFISESSFRYFMGEIH